MVDYGGLLALTGYAIGAVGAGLVFIEFFQMPNYVEYDTDFQSYNVQITPTEVREYSWAGRIGAFLIAVAFALEFVAALV